jgi:hypothetical protein
LHSFQKHRKDVWGLPETKSKCLMRLEVLYRYPDLVTEIHTDSEWITIKVTEVGVLQPTTNEQKGLSSF